MIRLGFNIDHIATVRNARGGAHPDPLRAALAALAAGAHGITCHLREDRRHIRDADVRALMGGIDAPLNLEMAATAEMRDFALTLRPHAVCIVPERREELTTEGGLDLSGRDRLAPFIAALAQAGMRVSLFIDPEPEAVRAAADLGAAVVELHTGAYCEAYRAGADAAAELARLHAAAAACADVGLELHAGHGLDYDSVGPVAALPGLAELNIGHFLVGEALFGGIDGAIARMLEAIHP